MLNTERPAESQQREREDERRKGRFQENQIGRDGSCAKRVRRTNRVITQGDSDGWRVGIGIPVVSLVLQVDPRS